MLIAYSKHVCLTHIVGWGGVVAHSNYSNDETTEAPLTHQVLGLRQSRKRLLNFAHDLGKCSPPIGLCKCMSTSMSSLSIQFWEEGMVISVFQMRGLMPGEVR